MAHKTADSSNHIKQNIPRTDSNAPHVVALSGSRRDGSYTNLALKQALSAVHEAGGTSEMIDLSELDLPPLDPDRLNAGDGQELRDRISNADAVIIGTPMYHGSYSGVLKNAIDYCGFDEFENKTIGLLVVSGGPFPTSALDHLRSVGRSLRAWVLPHQVAIPQAHSVFDEEHITDEGLRTRLFELGKQMVEYAQVEPKSNPTESVPA